MVLLAALIAYPPIGPALFLHLHHSAANAPDQPWQDFLDSLTLPRSPPGTIPLTPNDTVQAQQWQPYWTVSTTSRKRRLNVIFRFPNR